ncbi:MAG TPA: hypothetical protein VFA07_19235 [Chthonomonadaceae bacterium]|nr:hypothetical protein [Chthonomonadaceae bacterium]
MSRRFVLILPLVLSLGAFLAVAASADTAAQARKAIQAAYDKQSAAMARKDVNGSFASCAPECKNITQEGKTYTLKQIKELAAQTFALAKTFKEKTTINHFRLIGNKAIVTATDHAVLTSVNPGTSQITTMTEDEVDEDIWVKRSNRWWLIQSKTIKDTYSRK